MRNRSRLGIVVLALPLVVLPFTGAIADPATQPQKDKADTVTQSQPKSQDLAEKEKPAAGEESGRGLYPQRNDIRRQCRIFSRGHLSIP